MTSILNVVNEDDNVSLLSSVSSSSSNGCTTIHTQEELKHSIRTVLEIDARLQVLKREKKELETQRKAASEQLIQLMRERDIDSFDTSKAQLLYKKSNIKSAISKKFLMKTIEEYFDGDSAAATKLHKYILDQIPQQMKESLVLHT